MDTARESNILCGKAAEQKGSGKGKKDEEVKTEKEEKLFSPGEKVVVVVVVPM